MEFPTQAMDIFFYVFGAIGLITALFGVVLGKNPISSAFSLVVVFFCVAAMYVLQQAHFLGAIQILVYAGAIMVLFVFVIMLLNADTKNYDLGKSRKFQIAGGVLCAVLLALFIYSVRHGTVSPKRLGLSPERVDSLGGNVQVVSQLMFSDYILPFELTSILLLVGIVGSVALAKRKHAAEVAK
jgi:NADH-quinone oxidoreductase subunit J